MIDVEVRALIRRHYRWWKVFGWWRDTERGLKLGPITFAAYHYEDRWEIAVVAFCAEPWIDTGLARMRRPQ